MSEPVEVSREGDVAVVSMRAGENRFQPDFLDALDRALDTVEAMEGPHALVLTGEGRFFSNGLDLDWMLGAPEGGAAALVQRVQALLARVLTLPMATVAALNGHTFAAGAMLALACDERLMRADRGFFCLPEVDIGLPFTDGMSALIRARLTPQVAHMAMIGGERLGGGDAARRGIVSRAVTESEVLPLAIERAASLAGKQGATMGAIKRRIYAHVLIDLAAEAELRLQPTGG